MGSLQKCSLFCCKRVSWKTFVCQETVDIPGYSSYYWSAQTSYPKGIQTPGRAMEKISAAWQAAMDGADSEDRWVSSPMWRDQRCLCFISPAEAEMCNFISPVDGAGWVTVWQGICCCKVAGALQHFTKSAHTVSSWCSGIWSTGIHARFHHWYLPSYDHRGL